MDKKWISSVSLVLACCTSAACMSFGGKESSSNIPSIERAYNTAATLLNYEENDQRMDIFAYYPDNTENGMRLAKEAGISHFLLTRDREYISSNPDAVQNTIALAAEQGILSIPFTGHLGIDNDQQFKREVSPWLYSDDVAGIYYYDEPYMQNLPDIGNRVPFFEENFKGKIFLSALHASPVVSHPTWGSTATYNEYVSTFCEQVLGRMSADTKKILMVDCYPLAEEWGEYGILPYHLYTMMEIAANAKDYGAEACLSVQTLEHTVGNGATLFPAPTIEAMRLQIYSLLSFGYKRYALYCYDTRPDVPGEDNRMGMVQDGEETPTYSVVKQVNEEILAFDNVYLSFDWQGIIPVTPTDDQKSNFKQLTSYGKYIFSEGDTQVLDELTSDNNILCGVFQDEAGNEGYALTNYCSPREGKTANVQLRFSDCDKAIVYQNGQKRIVDLANNTLAFTMNTCDGAFVIPYKA